MTELLPCPFCGGENIYVTHTHYYEPEDTVCVFCNGCKSLVILEQNEAEGINYDTEAEAIAAWNTRYHSPFEETVIKAWKEIQDHQERTCRSVFDDNMDGTSVCSECGGEFPQDPDRRWRLNYCPNCGAKVVEQ